MGSNYVVKILIMLWWWCMWENYAWLSEQTSQEGCAVLFIHVCLCFFHYICALWIHRNNIISVMTRCHPRAKCNVKHIFHVGEEADVVSGLPQAKTNPLETALLAREQVNNLMERYTLSLLYMLLAARYIISPRQNQVSIPFQITAWSIGRCRILGGCSSSTDSRFSSSHGSSSNSSKWIH